MVHGLRKSLGTERIETRRVGYLLAAAAEEVDLRRFGQLDRQGHAALVAGDARGASGKLGDALELWHGEPVGGPPAEMSMSSAEGLSKSS